MFFGLKKAIETTLADNDIIIPRIKGATWFQGENNCAECSARCNGKGRDPCHDPTAGPNVCGNLLEKSGYPCYLKVMIDSWRGAPGLASRVLSYVLLFLLAKNRVDNSFQMLRQQPRLSPKYALAELEV